MVGLSHMAKRSKSRKGAVKADPTQWSEKGRRSVASEFTTEYRDISYFCWRCGQPDVFTAQDQKQTYEVQKRHPWQQRLLCQQCWREANAVRANLADCEKHWSQTKAALTKDTTFLSRWLHLLITLEEYVPHRPDTARKNMLTRLIKRQA
jgi:Probable zinc-ribbon domain